MRRYTSSIMAGLYRGMDRAALDAAYNNGAAVRNSAEIVAIWRRRSDALRKDAKELRYGPAERNRIDLLEARPDAPLLVFIHGGYWQAREKELFTFLAQGPLAHGISVALVGYTLAPQKRLDGIVAEVRAALDFLARPLVVSGWSAGGHLTAMMMSHPNARAGLAISGIFDLEPMRLCYINEKLRLDEAEARRNSPLVLPKVEKELVLSFGTAELPELQRQSREFAAKFGHRLLPLEGHDHFTILEELASPEGALTDAARKLALQGGAT
jgi:acetyl esterase/lipase